MNASDIIKAKQNQTLYKSYYQPTVFQSTIYSTLTIGSSILNKTGPSISSINYYSCNNIVNTYVCNPTFISYQFANDVKQGEYSCGGKVPSQLQWKNVNSTLVYAYSTVISSFSTPSNPIISTFRLSSTIVMTGPQPIICPLIDFYQGTNFDNRCNICNNFTGISNACCNNCASGQ